MAGSRRMIHRSLTKFWTMASAQACNGSISPVATLIVL
jgi:hypothetical protein